LQRGDGVRTWHRLFTVILNRCYGDGDLITGTTATADDVRSSIVALKTINEPHHAPTVVGR